MKAGLCATISVSCTEPCTGHGKAMQVLSVEADTIGIATWVTGGEVTSSPSSYPMETQEEVIGLRTCSVLCFLKVSAEILGF